MEERIYLSQPQQNGSEMEYIKKAFSTNNLTLFGDNITEFEKGISQYVDNSYTLATCSGTAALHLALRNVGVGPGDVVFCSSLTFAASCSPILYQGGTPVFIDSSKETWNMSPQALERALDWANKENKLPKAAVVVDLYGQPAEYDLLLPIFEQYKVAVIEDAAEALGSTYLGKKCGTFGKIGAFSFNSNKVITTGGGGMAISRDGDAIERMRYWSAQAREPLPYYEHKDYGYQYRMSNILAGIGCAQMKSIDHYVSRRKMIYERYREAFQNMPLQMMPKIKNGSSNCWLSVVSLEDSTLPIQLIEFLERYQIESRMVWKPMHLQPIYKNCMYFSAEDDGDMSRSLFENGLCLPSASVMTDDEQGKVIELIHGFFKGNR
jgi:pyridoxal phosphate-dependent aminotransferase EpsN